MIYVDRYRSDENGKRIKPSRAWFQKAARATRKALRERANHEADRNIYADDQVKAALEKLFNDKCAYCETKITAGSDWDVEHFRPKSRVAESEGHPGYYWLAYEWENLYSSCTHCNQRRKDRRRWGNPIDLSAGGKQDQFPLVDESTRAKSEDDDVLEEHTLLIDPCFDTPEWYLAYDPLGQVFALEENPYGAKTIDVFHLRRSRLRDRRREKIEDVRAILKWIKQSRDRNNADAETALEELLEKVITDDQEYSGVARYVVENPERFDV